MNRIKENINKTITHEQPDEEPEPKNITFNEAFKAIKLLRNHLLQNDIAPNTPPTIIQLDLVECFLEKEQMLKIKFNQTNILDYFAK